MKNIILVAQREYLSEVRKKSFIIMTLLMPVLILVFGVVVGFMAFANDGQKNIGVIDKSNLFASHLQSSKSIQYHWYASEEEESIKDTLAQSEYLDALLVIPEMDSAQNFLALENQTQLFTSAGLGIELESELKGQLNDRIEELKLKEKNISLEDIEAAKTNISLTIFNVKEGKEDNGSMLKLIISGVLTYVVFMFILIYGVRVMRSVVEEKTNRVIEIIISSVKPFQLMMGKILGTTLVALTQFVIWIVMIMGGMVLFSIVSQRFIDPSEAQASLATSQNAEMLANVNQYIDIAFGLNYPLIITVFLVFFFLGYLFYSAIFTAIGAAVDSDTDTQQFTWIATVPLMLGTYGSYFAALKDPEGPVAFWLSMVPFTSPIAMVTRVPYAIPWWEIVLSLLILIASTIAMIFIAAKIYRVGILMHGKKASYKEIWRWIKYSH